MRVHCLQSTESPKGCWACFNTRDTERVISCLSIESGAGWPSVYKIIFRTFTKELAGLEQLASPFCKLLVYIGLSVKGIPWRTTVLSVLSSLWSHLLRLCDGRARRQPLGTERSLGPSEVQANCTETLHKI